MWRARTAVALVVLGVSVAVIVAIADGFRPIRWRATVTEVVGTVTELSGLEVPSFAGFRFDEGPNSVSWLELAQTQGAWTTATAGLLAIPIWFAWWRHARAQFARPIGLVLCAAVASGLCLLTLGPNRLETDWISPANAGTAIWLLVSCAMFAAAFVLAPRPRRGDDS